MTVDLPFAKHAVRDLVAHRRKVYCLDWSCNGKKLATGSNDQTVRVWSVDSKHRDKAEKPENEYKHTERLVSLLWNPSNADMLATAALEKGLRLWDTRSGKTSTKVPTVGVNYYLAWSVSDPNVLATGSDANTVSFVDLRRNRAFKTVKHNQLVRLKSPCISPGVFQSSLNVQRLLTGPKEVTHGKVNELAFTVDGKLFLQATDAGVEVYSYPALEKLTVLFGHIGTVNTIALDATDRWLVSGGADGVAAVWDLSAMACVRTCIQLDGEVKTSSTSADSRWLAYAGDQDAVVIEALQEDGRKPWMVPLTKPPRSVDSVAWNPKYPVLAMTGAFSENSSHGFGSVFLYAPL